MIINFAPGASPIFVELCEGKNVIHILPIEIVSIQNTA